MDATIEDGKIVLTPSKKPQFKARVVNDPITGLPVLDVDANEAILTSEDVAELLATFP
jgi:hypothetical protein